MNGTTLARAHGLFNVVGGIWPLVDMCTFERVFGRKTDRWLVQTVAGLLTANGITQLAAGRSGAAVDQARRIGVGTALTLAAIDLTYASRGRISRMYLADAALELGWVIAWLAQWRASRAQGR